MERTSDSLPPAADAAPVLDLRGVHKSFGRGARRVDAVRGVDLTVHRGDVVALLGHNGAGKSVTLDMALGLQAPSSGEVRVCGDRPSRAVSAGRVGAMLQSGALLDDLRVAETVRAVASLHPGGRRRVGSVMDRAGLTPLATRRVSRCSGGEKQRLRFALALLPDPDLMVLDEPTAGMDVSARQEFWEVVSAEAQAGRTIVFATHYLAEAEEYAPRTVLMAGGRVIADDTTEAVRSRVPGRVLTCTTPDAGRLAQQLAGEPDVVDVRTPTPDRLEMRVTDSDRFARLALTEWRATGLQIVPLGLDEAFAELTREATDPHGGTDPDQSTSPARPEPAATAA